MIAELRMNRKHILRLTFLYVLSQGLILVVSGLWFDDWCIINLSDAGLKQWSLEMGKPEFYPIVSFIIMMPNIVYKLIIFVGYYIVMVSFFIIVKSCFSLEIEDAYWLTLIYLCVPVNDCRIERLGLPYTLGLTLFFIAFCFLVCKYDELNIRYRIISLALFFFSYILNSMLVFMGLVWIFIIVKEKCLKGVVKKVDYFVLPFVYFFIDGVFFPAQGVYTGYNGVSIKGTLRALVDTIKKEGDVSSQIISIFSESVVSFPMLIIIAFVLLCILKILEENKKHITVANDGSESVSKEILKLIFGMIVLFAGLFPYVVVRNTITISGFNSRNTILVPFGFALVIHSIFKVALRNNSLKICVYYMFLVSAVHFFIVYTSYQSSYYIDKGLQIHLANHPEIKELKNIGVISEEGRSWYEYNGIFEEVYGDDNRFVENMNDSKTLDLEKYSSYVEREWYNMTGCDITYEDVDCVILYENSISRRKALSSRIHEILGEDITVRLISDSRFKVIYPDDDEFDIYVEQ